MENFYGCEPPLDPPYVRERRDVGYWYLTSTFECPVCGCGHTYRERIYDRPKPDNPNERYTLTDDYDGCLG